MKKYNLILLLTICISVAGCYSDIDLNHLRPDPKLVLNCKVSPDSCIVASVSRTWFLTENSPDVTIKNAKVEVYLNGNYQEDMQWIPAELEEEGQSMSGNHYSSKVWPTPGDHVKLIVSAEGYQPVQAEATLPRKVDIEEVAVTKTTERADWSSTYMDKDGNWITTWDRNVLNYRITFQDPPGEKNYYLVRISPSSYLDFSTDPLFRDNVSFLDDMFSTNMLEGISGFVFSDERINGEKYTLLIKDYLYHWFYPGEEEEERKEIREIQLYSISPSYYHYFLSAAQAAEDGSFLESLSGVGLAEPLRIYSNVEGGTGILIASDHSAETIDITHLLNK